MPELPVQEVRRSELHLPEISRDDIVRSLSEIHLPSVEMPSVDLRRAALPDAIRDFDWRSIDIPAALAGAAAVIRIGRPAARRGRWPLVIGAVVVVGVVAAALANPTVRERLSRTTGKLREKLDSRMTGQDVFVVDEDRLDVPESVKDLAMDGGATASEMSSTDGLRGADQPETGELVDEVGRPA
jgi:hypothetical protein